ncbi:hypothetical protein Scep_029795 [Stephania cephalantha]|uniref:Uncharacterized protein n=1 Tax=Stephania cephalantha TaxID=152367 RepID=A0AAP0HDT8_9MAGN
MRMDARSISQFVLVYIVLEQQGIPSLTQIQDRSSRSRLASMQIQIGPATPCPYERCSYRSTELTACCRNMGSAVPG